MGKFLTEVMKAFPKLDEGMHVVSLTGTGKKTNYLQDRNGNNVTVGAVLAEMDSTLEFVDDKVRKFYCPFKIPGGPLAISFEKFLLHISPGKTSALRSKLEKIVKASAITDWNTAMLVLLDSDPAKRKAAFSAFFVANDEKSQGMLVQLAAEYSTASIERKEIIDNIVAKLTWENMLKAPAAEVIEAGIGMDIGPNGDNRVAEAAGGYRSRAANDAWNTITEDQGLKENPVFQQAERCGMFLAYMGRIVIGGNKAIEFAGKPEENKDYFYDNLDPILADMRMLVKEIDTLENELYQHQKDWAHLNHPEADIVSSVTNSKVIELMHKMEEGTHNNASNGNSVLSQLKNFLTNKNINPMK